MKPWSFLYSVRFAAALGTLLLALVSTIMFLILGWFGIFIVGVIGMIITTRIDLHDGNAISDFDYGSTSVTMFAKQIKQRDQLKGMERLRDQNDRRARSYLVYVLNTVWLSMIGLGLAMFSVHQL